MFRKTLAAGLATVALTAMAFTAPTLMGAGAASKGGGKPRATAVAAAISAPNSVYGSTVTATVATDRTDAEVFTQCYTPTLDGTYVYAAFSPVVGGQSQLGPLWATTWARSDATCTAQLGYVTRDGWGRWTVLASTTFMVTAS